MKAKETVKKLLVSELNRQYQKEYTKAFRKIDYSYGIEEVEKSEECLWQTTIGKDSLPSVDISCFEVEDGFFSDKSLEWDKEVFVFVAKSKNNGERGALAPTAVQQIRHYFAGNPDVSILYADEDVRDESHARFNPWLKPNWSPDLFKSYFYFGSVVAIRSKVMRALLEADAGKVISNFYALCMELLIKADGFSVFGTKRVGHINRILFHNSSSANYEDFLRSRTCEESATSIEKGMAKELVSIIIPSKDNAEILKQNLYSVKATVKEQPFEVIIVDNGSKIEEQEKIQKLKEELINSGISMKYVYERIDFNFSRMCNIGANVAKGELLLFLNDDVEAVEENWLEKLVEKAKCSYIGAVGAKLLYPKSQKIQHAGITNISLGPVHKLQFHDDSKEFYFRKNRVAHNVLGVTGACLMIRKEVFNGINGFCEDLPVAFNDVDLCFTLHEQGYFNVVRNDIFLRHHESLSRGNDESEEKLKRLMGERKKLYDRHPKLDGVDPFYHRWLSHKVLDTRIRPVLERDDLKEEVRSSNNASVYREKGKLRLHPGLLLRVEALVSQDIQGYGLMLGDDNACYENKLIFSAVELGKKTPATKEEEISLEEEVVWSFPLKRKIRQDLEENMPDQINVALSGFAETVTGLPKGDYYVGAIMKNKITRVIYINWCHRIIHVE